VALTPQPEEGISVKVNLELLSGPLDGEVFSFSSTADIGRESTCEVPIPVDKFISRHHARILVVEPECFLEDLDSTNGTFIEGQRLRGRIVLAKGQTFRVGKTWMQISW
jgi:pSer/pThr/pTyr-binding forkhead associated (FHA) protein